MLLARDLLGPLALAFPVLFGELAIMLWLVIKGAKVQPLAAAAT